MSQSEEEQMRARFQWSPDDVEFAEEAQPTHTPITVEELQQRTAQMSDEDKARLLAEASDKPADQQAEP